MKKSIAIIGAGFSGLMTAVHLLKNASENIEISLISPKENFARGVAYKASSKHHLLNVPAGKMSAFQEKPTHFLDWLAQREPYKNLEKNLLATIFVPRNLYGDYLEELWTHTKQNAQSKIQTLNDEVIDIEELKNGTFELHLKQNQALQADLVVLAVGNEAPKNPETLPENVLRSALYFQDPWARDSIEQVENLKNILLIGNGLTMVDVVSGLEERGFKGKIYSISPNGFQILPHRHNGIPYNNLLAEIPENLDLGIIEWFSLFRKHIRFVRQFGISAEPVIDSIRSISPKIWQKLSLNDRKAFLRHLRHRWGVARHRLPVYVYDSIQEKQRNGSLHIIKGKILDASLQNSKISLSYWDKKQHNEQNLLVDRVINCTGPNTDLRFSANSLLQNLFVKQMIEPDDLYLGIKADQNGAIICQNKKYENFYTLGSALKGLFWESTAVPELRQQAESLAKILLHLVN
ncbi:MAG: FAD/NAD(P)-binding protein [Raineya sp.]